VGQRGDFEVDERATRLPRHRRREVLHHDRVGIERSNRGAVLVPPLAQQEPLGAQLGHVRVVSFSTYFASTSASRLTRPPGSSRPSVVTASVCGISATAKPLWSVAATVRLVPWTAIEPF